MGKSMRNDEHEHDEKSTEYSFAIDLNKLMGNKLHALQHKGKHIGEQSRLNDNMRYFSSVPLL